jgi:diacylglycerol O-acyltransferase
MTDRALNATERMTATDAIFWLLDTVPELRSTIGAVMILARPPPVDLVRSELVRLTRFFPHMRQVVTDVPLNLAPPEWTPDADFDLDYHLRAIAIPTPGGMRELLAAVSPLYATPLDRSRPLWEAYLVEGLLDGRGAMFFKLHHCLTDGVGGTRLFEAMCGEARTASPAPSELPVLASDTTPGAVLRRAWQDTLTDLAQVAGDLAAGAGTAVLRPLATLEGIRRGMRMATAFGRTLTAAPHESVLQRHRSSSRALAVLDLPLADVDTVRRRLAATNNDIVLTLLTGALHRWHTSRGADVHELRVLVPVSLRDEGDATQGNRIGLLHESLPVGEPNPLTRLRLIQERMRRFKTARGAALFPVVARVLLLLPRAVAATLGRQQMQRANLVCTNVPGPRQTCFWAGEAVERIYPFAPLVGDHPLSVALFSYRDTVCVGIDVDPLAMPDLPHFVDAFDEARRELLAVAGATGDPAGPWR